MTSMQVLSWSGVDSLDRLRRALRQGGVQILPTDTIYGFSGLAESDRARQKIVRLKGRSEAQGFVVLVDSREKIRPWLAPATGRKTLEWLATVWPGAVTVVLPLARRVPWGMDTPQGPTAAFRVPDYAELLALLRSLPEPLISTSVNRHGEPPMRDLAAMRSRFANEVDYMVDAGTPSADAASTLVDATVWPPKLIRPGLAPWQPPSV